MSVGKTVAAVKLCEGVATRAPQAIWAWKRLGQFFEIIIWLHWDTSPPFLSFVLLDHNKVFIVVREREKNKENHNWTFQEFLIKIAPYPLCTLSDTCYCHLPLILPPSFSVLFFRIVAY